MATLFEIIKQNKEGSKSSIPVYKDGGLTKENIQGIINKYSKGRSPLSAENYIKVSNETGVPVELLLVQGIQESNFGTAGRAVRTKNVGNVGNTDDGSARNMGSWEDGLRAQANLLKKEYGATSKEAVRGLIENGFVRTKDKARYASDPLYEKRLSGLLKTITGQDYSAYTNSSPNNTYGQNSPYSQLDFSNVTRDFSQMNSQIESNIAYQKAMVEAMQSETNSKIALNQAQIYALEKGQEEKLAIQEVEKKKEEQEQIQSVLEERNKQRETLMEVGMQAIPEYIENETNALNQLASSPMNFQFQGGFQQLVQGQKGGMFSKMYDDYEGISKFKNSFIKKYQKGGTVRELYESQTGKSWKTAKDEGLTDGTYEGNMKLRDSLMRNVVNTKVDNSQDYSSSNTFTEAFKKARQELGKNNVFTYQGKKFGTNVASEVFTPSDEVVEKYGLKREYLNAQNKQVESPYTSKEVVKVEREWKNWDDVRNRQSEINKMEDADKVVEYNKEKNPNEQYIIVDKKNSRVHVYKGGSLLSTYDAILGENKGDAQTVTKIVDGKVDWNKGNMSTGAGVFEISNVNEKNESYYGLPSFNLKNSNGLEVSTAFHGTPKERREFFNDDNVENNRKSNGCVNGQCEMLEEFVQKYNFKKGDKVYILPEDEGNRFEIEDGKPVLKVEDRNKYLKYTDSEGNEQTGQGVNINTKTLNYKPIKFQYLSTLPQAGKDAAQALTTKKQQIMKDLKINSDVYNDLSLLALGIMGQESGYGESARYNIKHYAPILVDTLKAIKGDNSNNSQGLSQIKIDSMNEDTKTLLESYGITKDNVWNSGEKAGLATMLILGKMFNDELKDTKILKNNKGMDYTDALMYIYQGKKKDLLNKTATPDKNKYINNVKKFKKNFILKQYM